MGIFRNFAARVPILGDILEALVELERLRAERDQLKAALLTAHQLQEDRAAAEVARDANPFAGPPVRSPDSADGTPWKHPFLTLENITRFRTYSERVWEFALDHDSRSTTPLNAAFCVNMAQSMYKWARLTSEAGARSTLYLHPLDLSAISLPQWEEYDGEFPGLLEGRSFLSHCGDLPLAVETRTLPMDDRGLLAASLQFRSGNRKPLLKLLGPDNPLRHEPMLAHEGVYPYYDWARALSAHDVSVTASVAIPAYLSGRPYLAFVVGGDLWFDCGRGSPFGEIMALSYNAARFVLLSNPHPIAHCRRLGFQNAVYLPYAMDDMRYSPGEGSARREWIERFGDGIYVLSSARIDAAVKGNGVGILDTLAGVARSRPQLRVIFLAWGKDVEDMKAEVARRGLQRQLLFLSPVGKKRLIDYYRSCDLVLDQFHLGYYGASALEAASVGKPIVMRIREDQYSALYRGDVAPVCNVPDATGLGDALLRLIDSRGERVAAGQRMREWLVRTHGSARTVPLLLALMRLAADSVPLPPDLLNPLQDAESEAEVDYNKSCETTLG